MNNTYALVGSTLKYSYNAVNVHPNGMLYFAGGSSDYIYEFDPITQTGRDVGACMRGHILGSGVLWDDGSIYYHTGGAGNKIVRFVPDNLVAPDPADLVIPSDLSTLATSNYNRYYNKQ